MAKDMPFTYDELVKAYNLTEEDCIVQVSDILLEKICSSCCGKWRFMCPHLGMEAIVKEDIDRGPGGEEEKRYTFFTKWKKMKGSRATYKRLIGALLNIYCGEDAEKVCKLLSEKDSISLPKEGQSTVSRITGSLQYGYGCVSSFTSSSVAHFTSSSSAQSLDVQQQLQNDLQNIIQLYGSYVSCILESLQAKGVHVKDLRAYLLNLSVVQLTETKPKLMLLSQNRADLEKAIDLNEIFNFLSTNHASFLHYEIFAAVAEKYEIVRGKKYPEELKAWINKHRVPNFATVNLQLKEFSEGSKKLVLRLDIKSTCELARLKKLKPALANVLGVKASMLEILDVESSDDEELEEFEIG